MGEFSGKVAVVTGGTSGIGNAIARLLVAEGARVVVAGRNCERLVALEQEFGAAIVGERTDVMNEESIESLIATTVKRFGHLDIAFNVVGGAGPAAAIVDTTAMNWEAVMNLTCRSVFLGIKHQAKQMISQERGGAIVNVSSVNQFMPIHGSAVYSAAKAGVGMLTKNAALELAKERIRVNAVLPGLTDTRPNQRSRRPEIRSAYLDRIPLRRSAVPSEIANPAIFLASEAASYITGASLIVDGGWALTGYPDASRWF